MNARSRAYFLAGLQQGAEETARREKKGNKAAMGAGEGGEKILELDCCPLLNSEVS